jgi:hypothetical protein
VESLVTGAEAAMAVEEAVVTHPRLLSREPSCWCSLVRELFSPVTSNADFSTFLIKTNTTCTREGA